MVVATTHVGPGPAAGWGAVGWRASKSRAASAWPPRQRRGMESSAKGVENGSKERSLGSAIREICTW